MPSRNIIREFAPENYYHVYNRGNDKRNIFIDAQDYQVFIGLLKKYLIGQKNRNRHQFDNLHGKVELLAFCLMPNHFHLLVYQQELAATTQLMRRLMTGYVMYFNRRHKRSGGLFQGKFKAALVDRDAYLQHVVRYIHLNPRNYRNWPYSSLTYYQNQKRADWLNTEKILELFDNREDFMNFMMDYEANKKELDLLKWQLANGAEIM